MRPTELSLRNFKRIASATIHLAPITVLIGANNAGKSSFLQSLAIAAQSVDQPKVNTRSRLDFATDPVSLTRRNGDSQSDGWSLSLDWEDENPPDHPISPGRPIRVHFQLESGREDLIELWSASVTLEAPVGRPITVVAANASGRTMLKVVSPNYSNQGLRVEAIDVEVSVDLLPSEGRIGRFAVPGGATTDKSIEDLANREHLVEYAVSAAVPYLRERISAALSNYRYIGPDRHIPRSTLYLPDQPSPWPITPEDLASVLAYRQDIRLGVDRRCREVLGYGLATDFALGRNADLIATSKDGVNFSVINMGAGYAQVVWIATMLELQRQAARTLRGLSPIAGVEEPELHLHPRAQPNLAEALASYANAGLYLICTSQSEHFLIALLQLVLKGTIPNKELAVYFIEDGKAERLEVDELGRLSGGLRGFFEVNEEELLEQLQLLMKKGKPA